MKTFYILSLLLFLLVASSCYKDKGNYDYDAPMEITVDSIAASYTCYYLTDTLRIEPEIMPANVEYDCWWGIANKSSQTPPRVDTLYYTQNLEFPVNLSPGSYTLIFCAKEKLTGVANMIRIPLTVTTGFSTGWYVLRAQEGYTDFDLFAPTGKIENVIAINNEGRNLKGEARNVAHFTWYSSWDESTASYNDMTNTLFAVSAEDIAAIRVYEGSIIHTFEDVFYEVPTGAPQDVFGGTTDMFLVNGGKIHTISNSVSNTGRFGAPKSGDYHLSPWRVYCYWNYPLLFDEISSSFCSADPWDNKLLPLQDAGPDGSRDLPPVNNMDADLLFMGPTTDDCAYALLKKKQEDVYLMLNLYAACSAPYENPIQSWDTLRNDLGILDTDYRATNVNNHIIYFSKGNTIYSCNVDADYQEREQVTLPDGEEITYMRHLVFSNYSNPDADFDYFVVASYDGANYKVYLYSLQAGNLQGNPQVMEGKGKVGAVIYIDDTQSTELR